MKLPADETLLFFFLKKLEEMFSDTHTIFVEKKTRTYSPKSVAIPSGQITDMKMYFMPDGAQYFLCGEVSLYDRHPGQVQWHIRYSPEPITASNTTRIIEASTTSTESKMLADWYSLECAFIAWAQWEMTVDP